MELVPKAHKARFNEFYKTSYASKHLSYNWGSLISCMCYRFLVVSDSVLFYQLFC